MKGDIYSFISYTHILSHHNRSTINIFVYFNLLRIYAFPWPGQQLRGVKDTRGTAGNVLVIMDKRHIGAMGTAHFANLNICMLADRRLSNKVGMDGSSRGAFYVVEWMHTLNW